MQEPKRNEDPMTAQTRRYIVLYVAIALVTTRDFCGDEHAQAMEILREDHGIKGAQAEGMYADILTELNKMWDLECNMAQEFCK